VGLVGGKKLKSCIQQLLVFLPLHPTVNYLDEVVVLRRLDTEKLGGIRQTRHRKLVCHCHAPFFIPPNVNSIPKNRIKGRPKGPWWTCFDVNPRIAATRLHWASAMHTCPDIPQHKSESIMATDSGRLQSQSSSWKAIAGQCSAATPLVLGDA
jgi:hypothetical protein